MSFYTVIFNTWEIGFPFMWFANIIEIKDLFFLHIFFIKNKMKYPKKLPKLSH